MTHKEIKNNIHNKLDVALVAYKSLLGDKKYQNRIKKAAKLIAEGLGKEIKKVDPSKNNKVQLKPAIKKAAIPVVKKAAKAIVKKAVKPIAQKKPVATKKKVVSKAK
jgi:hypothetical protein